MIFFIESEYDLLRNEGVQYLSGTDAFLFDRIVLYQIKIAPLWMRTPR